MTNKQIFISSQKYDENSGGIICLHRLCHIINTTTNYKAYLVPDGVRYIEKSHSLFGLYQAVRNRYRTYKRIRKYKIHPEWNTPIWQSSDIPDDSIVIYAEMIEGNPLAGKNVVRWLLHQPGFHTGKIEYGNNELYFKFNSAILDFSYPDSVLSANHLKVIYYPIDIYQNDTSIVKDIDVCYMIRKGGYKKFIHDTNAVQVDGKSHQEIADIFRRSKRFICYDDYTAYSLFAVLCGCESVVVPYEGVALEQWYPDINDRLGIAYGLSAEQLEWAAATRHQVLERIINEHKRCEERVKICLDEMNDFFFNK